MEQETWSGQFETYCGVKRKNIYHSDPILLHDTLVSYVMPTHKIWLVWVLGYRKYDLEKHLWQDGEPDSLHK